MVVDKEYEAYVKQNYPNAKKISCSNCGAAGYDFYKVCNQCGHKMNRNILKDNSSKNKTSYKKKDIAGSVITRILGK